MEDKILYDENVDSVYILVYKLGEGACATVWFAIELKNFLRDKKISIDMKALKIHNKEDYEEGMIETKITELLASEKHENINYPTSYFVKDVLTIIVVYEVALGSLYDILKLYNNNLPSKLVNNIVEQMVNSIKFVHKNNYIHSDIKPENFLLRGCNKLQSSIVKYVKEYNLYDRLKLSKKKINKTNLLLMLKETIFTMLEEISTIYDIDFTKDVQTESTSSKITIDSKNSNISYNSTIGSKLNSDMESYISELGEYKYEYDKFNIKKILNDIEFENYENSDTNENMSNDELIYIKKFVENPHVLLTDFGLIQKIGSNTRTCQTRYYRCPKILFGLSYGVEIDYWALGCCIYELITGKILIDIDNNPYINSYDKDLINLLILIEKFGFNEIMKYCDVSPRKHYLINDDMTIKFIKKINFDHWSNNPFIIHNPSINKLLIELFSFNQ